MYKRINKRIRKKEKEEELGLDEETKEILGMQETDSDESDSSDEEQSDEGSEESDTDGEASLAGGRSRRGHKQLSDGGSSEVGSSSGAEAEDSEVGDEEMAEDEDEPPMTISKALEDPLYPIQKGSDVQGCILCPGKELKHTKMALVHVESSSHLRRMKRFAALAARIGNEEEDPRLLVTALDESARIVPKETSIKVSDEPRVSKKERRIAKRERRKERRVARQTEEQDRGKSVPKAQSSTDRVLEKKIVNRHSEAIAKQKAKSKHPKSHKLSRAKNSVL
ncbi:unnamed protein product [Rhizoctonia solani]|uniref:Uncharacterized protein n=1 Tax=Rhizoctonia solani TaxID=456999 RepID=A0A8H2WUJ0_9AGAM|nr:unnamed protein product [Rhizoctonia solani]